eukprot:COSAG05_NODE_355_length_10856_cov_7.197174_10_plen_229_part_00
MGFIERGRYKQFYDRAAFIAAGVPIGTNPAFPGVNWPFPPYIGSEQIWIDGEESGAARPSPLLLSGSLAAATAVVGEDTDDDDDDDDDDDMATMMMKKKKAMMTMMTMMMTTRRRGTTIAARPRPTCTCYVCGRSCHYLTKPRLVRARSLSRSSGVVDCESVGTVYMLPADVYRLTSAKDAGHFPTAFTEHFPVVHAAKYELEVRVTLVVGVEVEHANLPKYADCPTI